MTTYYFHIRDGYDQRDETGAVLPDIAAARRQAVQVLSEMLREQPDRFWRDGQLEVIVADETDLTLFVLNVSATLAPSVGFVRPS
jgi:hypothetical protein